MVFFCVIDGNDVFVKYIMVKVVCFYVFECDFKVCYIWEVGG